MSEASTAQTMSETNSRLASQCMEFTKHMVGKGMAFKFSLSLPTGFNFSMDFNQEKMVPVSTRGTKKQSPSTLKRNNLRKKAFLAKKAEEKQAEKQLVKSPAKPSERKFKCNQCDNEVSSKDCLDTHMGEEHNAHNAKISCKECDHALKTTDDIEEHVKESHHIEQLDESSEFQKINENTEPDELWCYKCEDQLPNRPAMKGHMHNEHHITIFEDIDIEKHGGFKWYRYPGKYYGH